ncbi:MAG: hypothetical protein ACYCQI_04640 [Gammaproteobacteria bacterium]
MQDKIRGIALLVTLKQIFDKNLQYIFENNLLEAYKYLDRIGGRDDVGDMLYYLLNEGQNISNERFWNILHDEFSPEVEDRVMTIAQQLRAEGFERGVESIAIKLLSENADLAFIVRITGLSLTKIHELLLKM